MALITANIEYLNGHLRYGHFELSLEGEKLEHFKSLPLKDQQDYISEEGDLLIDEYRLNDYGDIIDIKIHEK